MVDAADAFVHNIRPQKLEKIGLGSEALLARNPRLVYAGLHGWREDGPYSGRPAYDDIMQGLTGIGFVAAIVGAALVAALGAVTHELFDFIDKPLRFGKIARGFMHPHWLARPSGRLCASAPRMPVRPVPWLSPLSAPATPTPPWRVRG